MKKSHKVSSDEAQNFPTTRRKLYLLDRSPVYEHRRCKGDLSANFGLCVAFPEIACEKAREFNDFCRSLAADFFELYASHNSGGTPFCAVLSLTLEEPKNEDTEITLRVEMHRGNPEETLLSKTEICRIRRDNFRFLTGRVLTKKGLNFIL